MSIKQIQSEVGMVGEPSRNAELIKKIYDMLDAFEHDHSNETCNDNFLFITSIKMGRKIRLEEGEDDRGLAIMAMMAGCYEDICNSVCGFLIKNHELLPVFDIAIQEAFNQINENGGLNHESGN